MEDFDTNHKQEEIKEKKNSKTEAPFSNVEKIDLVNTFQNPINFRRGELIASGAYGKVYKCLDLNTGKLLAVKNVKVQLKIIGSFIQLLHFFLLRLSPPFLTKSHFSPLPPKKNNV